MTKQTGVGGCGGGCGPVRDTSQVIVQPRHVLERLSPTPAQAANIAQRNGTYGDWVTDVPVQGPTDPGIRAADCWWKKNVVDVATDEQGAMVPAWTQRSLCVGGRPCVGTGFGETVRRGGALGAPMAIFDAGAKAAAASSAQQTKPAAPAPPGIWSRLSDAESHWIASTLIQLNAFILKAGNQAVRDLARGSTQGRRDGGREDAPRRSRAFRGGTTRTSRPSRALRTDGTLDEETACALVIVTGQHAQDFPTPYPGVLKCGGLSLLAKIGIGVAAVAMVGGTVAAIAASQSKKKRAPVNLSEARRMKEGRVVITTVRDLDTWLANTRGDLTRHEREVAVEALRNSVHPRWGSDWSGWLDDHRHVVDDAVEDL